MQFSVRRTNEGRFDIHFARGALKGTRAGEADVVRMTNAVLHTNNKPLAVGGIQAVWGLALDPKLELTRMTIHELGIGRPFTTIREAKRGQYRQQGQDLAMWHKDGILPFASVLQLEHEVFFYSLYKKDKK